MGWMLVIFLVKASDPNAVQNIVRVNFDTEVQCNRALDSMDYWSKNKTYKVEARCIKQLPSA